MKIKNNTVELSLDTWKEIKENPMFQELVEFIEDREDLIEAISQKNENELQSLEDLKKDIGM